MRYFKGAEKIIREESLAPNFREVQACNICKFSRSVVNDLPGGLLASCQKYMGTEHSLYAHYVCDGFERIDGRSC